jgi:hypothetical protein
MPKALPVFLCGLLWAGAATAGVKPGGTLYIKARNTRVLKDPSASAAVVVVLQPGAAVTWEGPDSRDKRWHRVVSGKNKGVVLSANLTAEKPKVEVLSVSGEAAADTNAFMSSGAASKALGPGAIQYAKELKSETAADQLQRAENMAKTIGPREAANHARKAGLREAVGPSEGVAEAKP